MILAIETSAELASVALLHGERILSRQSSGVTTHSQSILPMVQSVLAETGISLRACSAIAFGVGPGSFTGVRTACGVVQGLAWGAKLPVVPVVTLLAMAQACREASTENRASSAADVLTVLDARMGEVYWAQYRFAGEWQVVTAPTLSAPCEVKPLGDVVACGNGLTAYSAEFSTHSFIAHSVPDIVPHAMHIALLGRMALTKGDVLMAHDAQPLYLRNNVALTTAERALNEKNAANALDPSHAGKVSA